MRPVIVLAFSVAIMLRMPPSCSAFGVHMIRPFSSFVAPLTLPRKCSVFSTPNHAKSLRPPVFSFQKLRSRPLVMTAAGRDVSNLLAGLNQAQTQAVTAPHGPTVVLAGPGSGKTRVLTHRIGYMLAQGVRPEQIMSVTFTNKAANEMKKRIKSMLGVHLDGDLKMTVGTFHGICVRLLREYGEHAGLDPNFLIFDDKQQEKLVEEALDNLKMDPNEYKGLRFTISRLKSEGLSPKEVHQSQAVAVGADDAWRKNMLQNVATVYKEYQKLLKLNNAVDFDDLLLKMRDLLRHNAEVRMQLQDRYRYLLVDEWQDTNTVQYEIVKLLTIDPKSSSVFVVGDADQSIYAFRGADIRNVRQFIADFDATKILLEMNYRSTHPIAASAQALIEHNIGRVKKTTKVRKPRGAHVKVFEAEGDRHEAQYVASELLRLVRDDTIEGGFREMAVMYRTNRQSRAIEEVLVRSGIPYHLVGGKKFYERREVRDVLAYLRLIANPADNDSFFRILNVPTRGIGKRSEEKIRELGTELGIPCYEVLQRLRKLQATKMEREEAAETARMKVSREDMGVTDLEEGMAMLGEALSKMSTEEHPFSKLSLEDAAVEDFASKFPAKKQQELLQFAEVIEFLTDIAAHTTPAELIDSLLRVTQYEDYLIKNDKTDSAQDRIENLMELKDASTLVETEGIEGLVEFLTTVVLDREDEDQEEIDIDEDVMKKPNVKLMTLHASKGLEFGAVFIVGLEDDCLPHARCQIKGKKTLDAVTDARRIAQQRENFEEERRLMYVGMTRAKDRLYLGFKRERMTFGQRNIELSPSRFLTEMITARSELFDLSMVSQPTQDNIMNRTVASSGSERDGGWGGPSAAARAGRGRGSFSPRGTPVTRRMTGSELYSGASGGGSGRGGYPGGGQGAEGGRGYSSGGRGGAGGQRGASRGYRGGGGAGRGGWAGGGRGRGGAGGGGAVKTRGVMYKNGKVVAVDE